MCKMHATSVVKVSRYIYYTAIKIYRISNNKLSGVHRIQGEKRIKVFYVKYGYTPTDKVGA